VFENVFADIDCTKNIGMAIVGKHDEVTMNCSWNFWIFSLKIEMMSEIRQNTKLTKINLNEVVKTGNSKFGEE
jgi:hypothetical protein